MFKEMRRKDRELEKEEFMELLIRGEYGILSTIGENGYPYGVPVNYVYMDNAIYFHSAVEGQKLYNIKNDDKVSFCVVGETCVLPEQFSTKYESVIIFGKANEIFEEEKNASLLEIINKYSKEHLEKGKQYIKNSNENVKVIKINIEHVTGKARK
ncbi:pyridoxamine 5'-phosphate oxidase family protein [Clostridium sp. C2-6-12]|uniref:pyridoxamine 5'-phosphate oxidase family protein n=1 Tax=Clostridium sp. C2-6-12 TaxID=2698832 RepID=UPI00136BB183|nr:pyridoxamine 5'-phosphate oxidase family protein [Clostridium sp. C2-6-12]